MLLSVYIHTGPAEKLPTCPVRLLWTSIPKVAGSIPTVVRLTFRPARCEYSLRVTSKTHLSIHNIKTQTKISWQLHCLKVHCMKRFSKYMSLKIEILVIPRYTLDSASNYSTIQKLKPWLQTQDIPMKWEDSSVFYFLILNTELKYLNILKLFKWWKLLFFKRLLASGKHQHDRHLFKWG
jgi:hypothetical protein